VFDNHTIVLSTILLNTVYVFHQNMYIIGQFEWKVNKQKLIVLKIESN
jgi:hypothetical protein